MAKELIEITGVQGRCPGCGHDGQLFLGSGGYVTCSIAECPNPGAASDLLAMRVQPDRLRKFHTARVGAERWSLAHPLDCDLATCKYDQVAQLWDVRPRALGTYAWHGLDEDPCRWEEIELHKAEGAAGG